jgi:hypothetical protein
MPAPLRIRALVDDLERRLETLPDETALLRWELCGVQKEVDDLVTGTTTPADSNDAAAERRTQ